MSRRAEHLFSIIGQVDDAFIDEAACPRRLPPPPPPSPTPVDEMGRPVRRLPAPGRRAVADRAPLARCRWERQWSSAPLQRGQQRRRRS